MKSNAGRPVYGEGCLAHSNGLQSVFAGAVLASAKAQSLRVLQVQIANSLNNRKDMIQSSAN